MCLSIGFSHLFQCELYSSALQLTKCTVHKTIATLMPGSSPPFKHEFELTWFYCALRPCINTKVPTAGLWYQTKGSVNWLISIKQAWSSVITLVSNEIELILNHTHGRACENMWKQEKYKPEWNALLNKHGESSLNTLL